MMPRLRENLHGSSVMDLERQLSVTLASQSERDQRLALTDELALKTALLEEADMTATKRAGLELRYCTNTRVEGA